MSPPGQHDAQFQKVLNRQHGYGFQYAVLRRVQDLFTNQKSPWFPEVAELPVVAQGETTHVDFILRQRHRDYYLIGECKRTNSDFGRWCFARAPYTARGQENRPRRVIVESCLCKPPAPDYDVTHGVTGDWSEHVYDIGLALRKPRGAKAKDEEKDEEKQQSSDRSAINAAVAQVLRGTSGLINHLFGHVRSASQLAGKKLTFVPVVFTTADLWVTDVDLSAADLTTGDLKEVNSSARDWIWFNHNRSPKLRHNLEPNLAGDIAKELESEFTRSVAIVSPAGIDSFLSQTLERFSWNQGHGAL
jgi:hypothetical protein